MPTHLENISDRYGQAEIENEAQDGGMGIPEGPLVHNATMYQHIPSQFVLRAEVYRETHDIAIMLRPGTIPQMIARSQT